jgi:hypothetical protein
MTLSVIQIIVSHVMVTDTQYNYNISCRLIPVCFGLGKLSVLDILLHSRYSKARYIHYKSFGFHSSVVEDLCLQGHDAVSLGK